MANFNLNVHVVPFFDSVKEPLTEDKVSTSVWNNGFDNLALEISGEGSGTIIVQGCINTINAKGEQLDDEEITWTNLCMISATDYSSKVSLTDKGIYHAGILGVSRVRINATDVSGELTIVGAFSK
ncbi:MAG: hypothetical protein J6T10_04580 [Methanobrevibacter sp.]|nr:hypothetical protein [Methanobrevibacter sp.]